MKISFNTDIRRDITEANINYYNKPFIHPKRKMDQHDFIYLLQGEWKIGQNLKSYDLKKDTLLILSANQTHYGVSLSKPNTKTMYFHVTNSVDDEFNCSAPNAKNIVLNSLNYVGDNKVIKKIFYDIVSAKLSGNEKKAAVLFDLLLIELDSMNQNSNTSTAVEKIRNLIQQNPEKFFSNSELAKMVNASVKPLKRNSKTPTAQPFTNTCLTIKLSRRFRISKYSLKCRSRISLTISDFMTNIISANNSKK